MTLKPGEQSILDNLYSKHPILKELRQDADGEEGTDLFILDMHRAWSESEDYPDEDKLIKYWICDSGEPREDEYTVGEE